MYFFVFLYKKGKPNIKLDIRFFVYFVDLAVFDYFSLKS